MGVPIWGGGGYSGRGNRMSECQSWVERVTGAREEMPELGEDVSPFLEGGFCSARSLVITPERRLCPYNSLCVCVCVCVCVYIK